MMAPSEFSLESVRQLMLANGGRITNHELVKSFRRWLTDPALKEQARLQFKDYVNTLATIKQEDGEKFLVLKKKYYPEYYRNDTVERGAHKHQEFYTNNPDRMHEAGQYGYPAPLETPQYGYPVPPTNRGSPSLLDEVMAGFSPPSRTMGRQPPSLQGVVTPQYSAPQPPSLQNVVTPPYSAPSSYPSSINNIPNHYSYEDRQTYQYAHSAQDKHVQYDRQSSQDFRNERQDLRYDRQYSQDLTYGKQSSQDLQYERQNSQDLRYERLNSQDLRYGRPPSIDASVSKRSAYKDDPSVSVRNPYKDVEDDAYNPGAFSPHFTASSRQSVSSIASHTSSGSFHGSPRSSFSTENSGQRSLAAVPPLYTPAESRILPPDPRGSMSAYSDGSPRGSISHLDQYLDRRKPEMRAPPPYRPPPVETAMPTHRPAAVLPPPEFYSSRPTSRNSATAYRGADRPTSLDLVPADLGLPPTPPRRIEPDRTMNPPPPLPRRSYVPMDESLGIPVITNQKQLSDSVPLSLSKSYGNLCLDAENKENLALRIEGSQSADNLDHLARHNETISVRERTKTFNRMASETEVVSLSGSMSKLAVKRRNSRAVEMVSRRGSAMSRDDESHDTASITTLDPTIKSWMIHVSKGDYQTAAKMLTEEPKLARNKDFTTGYTGLHWACKHGNADLVKLLAGTYQASVNVRSHGGYTPLHLAAQHGHQSVFDLLVQAYRADANIRDYSGKRPRQYMIQADNSTISLSNHTFRQLKDRRRTRTSRLEKNQGMLRFGSLSVKVKKTTEAFNNYFNNNHTPVDIKKWDNNDADKMPPPKFAPIKKRRSKRPIDFSLAKSAPTTPIGRSPVKEVIPEIPEERGSDSDSEFGFGNTWSNA